MWSRRGLERLVVSRGGSGANFTFDMAVGGLVVTKRAGSRQVGDGEPGALRFRSHGKMVCRAASWLLGPGPPSSDVRCSMALHCVARSGVRHRYAGGGKVPCTPHRLPSTVVLADPTAVSLCPYFFHFANSTRPPRATPSPEPPPIVLIASAAMVKRYDYSFTRHPVKILGNPS